MSDRSRLNQLGLARGYTDLVDEGLKAGTQDAAGALKNRDVIQRALDRGLPFGITKPGDYDVASGLVIDSVRSIDWYAPPTVTIYAHAATANAAHLIRTDPTQVTRGIRIWGGFSMARRDTPTDRHLMRMWNIEEAYFNVSSLRNQTVNGKYFCFLNQSRRVLIENSWGGGIRSGTQTPSDMWHCGGLNSDVTVIGGGGSSGDNWGAAGNADYGAYEEAGFVRGSVLRYKLRGLIINNCKQPFRTYGIFQPGSVLMSAGAGITAIAWDPILRRLTKSGAWAALAFGTDAWIRITAGTGVLDFEGNAVSGSAPLYARVRKLSNDVLQVFHQVAPTAISDVACGDLVDAQRVEIEIEDCRGDVSEASFVNAIDDTADPSPIPVKLIGCPQSIAIRDCRIRLPFADQALVSVSTQTLTSLRLDGVIEVAEGSHPTAKVITIGTTSRRGHTLLLGTPHIIRRNAGNQANIIETQSDVTARLGGLIEVENNDASANVQTIIQCQGGGGSPYTPRLTGQLPSIHASSVGAGQMILADAYIATAGNQQGVLDVEIPSVRAESAFILARGSRRDNTNVGNRRSLIRIGELDLRGAPRAGGFATQGQVDLIARHAFLARAHDWPWAQGATADGSSAPTFCVGNVREFVLFHTDFSAAALTRDFRLIDLVRYADLQDVIQRGQILNALYFCCESAITHSVAGTFTCTMSVGYASGGTDWINALSITAPQQLAYPQDAVGITQRYRSRIGLSDLWIRIAMTHSVGGSVLSGLNAGVIRLGLGLGEIMI
jgi:hypothetical protein